MLVLVHLLKFVFVRLLIYSLNYYIYYKLFRANTFFFTLVLAQFCFFTYIQFCAYVNHSFIILMNEVGYLRQCWKSCNDKGSVHGVLVWAGENRLLIFHPRSRWSCQKGSRRQSIQLRRLHKRWSCLTELSMAF